MTTSRYIVAIVGETVELSCSSQGYPRPQFQWFQLNSNNKLLERIESSKSSSLFSKRILQIDSSLILNDISVDDSGKYVCFCNNSVGQDRTEIQLMVRGMSCQLYYTRYRTLIYNSFYI